MIKQDNIAFLQISAVFATRIRTALTRWGNKTKN